MYKVHADQEIEIRVMEKGGAVFRKVNVHELESITLDGNGRIVDYTKKNYSRPTCGLSEGTFCPEKRADVYYCAEGEESTCDKMKPGPQ